MTAGTKFSKLALGNIFCFVGKRAKSVYPNTYIVIPCGFFVDLTTGMKHDAFWGKCSTSYVKKLSKFLIER